MTPDLIRRLPKTDLHVHLDGSLRLPTLIELARARRVPLPSSSEAGLRKSGLPAALRQPRRVPRGLPLHGRRAAGSRGARARQPSSCARTVRRRVCATSRSASPRSCTSARASTCSDVVRAVDAGIRRASAGLQRPARGGVRPRAAVPRRHHPLRAALLHAGSLRRLPRSCRGHVRGVSAGALRGGLHPDGPGGRAAAARGGAARSSASTSRARRRAIPPRTITPPTRWPTRRFSARPCTRARPTAPSRSSRPSATCTPTGSATARGSSTRRRSPTRASRTRSVRRAPRAVHRRQAHHDRGVPDVQPADRARAAAT